MENNNKLRVAMVPWLAFGHMNPYLNVAKLIAKNGHTVFFLSTEKNIERLPKIPPKLASQITFIKLKLPRNPNLPEGAEATTDLPLDAIPYLKHSFDGLEQQIAEFLKSSSPDWLIHDFAPYWVYPLASELGIRTVFFIIFIASNFVYLGYPKDMINQDPNSELQQKKTVEDITMKKPKWIPFETNVVPQHFIAKKTMEFILKDNYSGVSDIYRTGTVLKNCDIVAVRSSYEVEPEWIQVLEKLYEKPVFPMGQLPPTIDDDDDDSNINIIGDEVPNKTNEFIMKWLDEKPSKSVIYVAFGSEANISKEELTELSLGIELSGMSFLWVLKESQKTELPQEFVQRTQENGNGLLHTAWAPQVQILSHESVGGFLSHSGWSSVVEAICFQKPLILFPLQLDQSLNSRLLEEKKVGYMIPREDRDGSFTKSTVADTIKLVVVKEEGRVIRETVKEMSKVFADKEKQNQYIDLFVEYLESHKKNSTDQDN